MMARMSTNGNGALTAHLVRPTAAMSAIERSEQADAMRRQLVEVTAAHNALGKRVVSESTEALEANAERQREIVRLKADYDGHIAWHGRQSSFLARLRWLVTGR